MYNANAPIVEGTILCDALIAELQQVLKANIGWLDVAFGRAQRLVKAVNGKRIVTPNVYAGNWNGHGENDYIEVSPDAKIGNFCFFEVADPETVDWNFRQIMELKTPFSIIFWFDLRRVYLESDNRDIAHIKNEILTLLNGRTGLVLHSGGHIVINRIYEQCENIYRGYTLSEIDNQFLMHPFAGLRFDGVMTMPQPCDNVGRFVELYATSDANIGPGDVVQGKIGYGANGRVIGALTFDVFDEIYNRLILI